MKFLLALFIVFNISAKDMLANIKTLNWDGIEVVWLKDERFPTYDIKVYFADGALSDGYRKGTTKMMFDLLDAGTNRFNHSDIADNLEFFGVSHGANVNHEYATYSISGLVKDIVPTVKKVCHMFKDATYPQTEIKKHKKRVTSSMKNLLNKHGALASKAFREISLAGTPFAHPVSGKLKTIRKISRKNLLNKLTYFNNKVKKKIYISGPENSLVVKNIFKNDCGWTAKADYKREVSYKTPGKLKSAKIHLVTVPKANQAKVMAGKFLPKGEFENRELLDISSHYLGGGFTSVLMKELRTNRGLTYSAYAVAAGQKDYGRSVINTFTKTSTIDELLSVLLDVLKNNSRQEISADKLVSIKNSLKGGHPFQFESSARFLNEIMFFDHLALPYKEFYKYSSKIDRLTAKDIKDAISMLFPHEGMHIVVLGQKNLAKKLSKFGEVKIHSYKKFL